MRHSAKLSARRSGGGSSHRRGNGSRQRTTSSSSSRESPTSKTNEDIASVEDLTFEYCYSLTWRTPEHTFELLCETSLLKKYVRCVATPRGALVVACFNSKIDIRKDDIIDFEVDTRNRTNHGLRRTKSGSRKHILEGYMRVLVRRQIFESLENLRWKPFPLGSRTSLVDEGTMEDRAGDFGKILRHIFQTFSDDSNRLTSSRAAAMLSSALCGAFVKEAWPIRRWFDDLSNKLHVDSMSFEQFQKAFNKAYVYKPKLICAIKNAWQSGRSTMLLRSRLMSLLRTSRREGVRYVCTLFLMLRERRRAQRMVMRSAEASSLSITDCVNATQNENYHNREQEQQRRRRRRRHVRPALTLSEVEHASDVFLRPHIVARIMYVCSPTLSNVVFSSGLEGFRSVSDWWARVVLPLESLVGPVGTVLDVRAHSTEKTFRHKSFLRFLGLQHRKGGTVFNYVRMGRADIRIRGGDSGSDSGNIGMIRGMRRPILIIGNHMDISESSERRRVCCRLTHNNLAHCIHLTYRSHEGSGKEEEEDPTLQFAFQVARKLRPLRAGTLEAARAMLGGCSNRSGDMPDAWCDIFPPAPCLRIRHTTHDSWAYD